MFELPESQVDFLTRRLNYKSNERRTKDEFSKTHRFFLNENTSRTLTPIANN